MLCLLLFLLAGPVAAVPSVLIVYDPDSATHRTIVSSLQSSHGVTGADGPRVEFLEVPAADLDENIFRDANAELIITVGTKAAADLRQYTLNRPVLNIFLPRSAYERIHAKGKDTAAALLLDQPVERLIALARVLVPYAQDIGTLVGSNGEGGIREMQAVAQRFEMNLNVARIVSEEHPVEAIERLLQGSDVIVATFDPETYSPTNAKWLLYLAFQQRRPIIGFSYALLKAGAVGAVFSTPEQIATHAAELLDDWLETKRLPAGTVFPRYYHIGLNAPVAEKLGLSPPTKDDLERQVHMLLEEER